VRQKDKSVDTLTRGEREWHGGDPGCRLPFSTFLPDGKLLWRDNISNRITRRDHPRFLRITARCNAIFFQIVARTVANGPIVAISLDLNRAFVLNIKYDEDGQTAETKEPETISDNRSAIHFGRTKGFRASRTKSRYVA
jgi:hypothetical protein